MVGVDFRVDIHPHPEVNIIADLEQDFPFKNESIDEIYMIETLEHLSNPIHTMNEVYRVLRPDGKFHFEIPSTDGPGAFQDPTHKSFWNQNSFMYYTDILRDSYPNLIKCRFSIEEIRIEVGVKHPLEGITYVYGMLKKLPMEEKHERVSNEACRS